MTATDLNGILVVKDDPTESPLSDRAGKKIYWEKIRTLTLADGSVVYGCALCEYTSANVRSVRPHLRVHAASVAAKQPVDTLQSVFSSGMSLSSFAQRVTEVAGLEEALDQWRQRALTAEAKLEKLRHIIEED